MPDEREEAREFSFRQALPWTELFRAFSIALDWKKLVLAAMAMVVMAGGWWLLALIFGNPTEPKPTDAPYALENRREGEDEHAARQRLERKFRRDHDQWRLLARATEHYKHLPWEAERGANPVLAVTEGTSGPAKPGVTPATLASYEFWRDQAPVLLEPLDKFIRPIGLLLSPNKSFTTTVFAFLGILWTLLIWAMFGGAITRIAAVQIARKEKIGLAEALRFSSAKILSFFLAPLFPFVAIVVISIFMIIGGLFLHLNWLGDLLSSLFWFLALVGGFVMALVLVGFVGWPLMYSTISTEGSDSFDAISRSYSYVYQRPWQYLFYWLVAIIYGAIVIFFVVFFTSLFVYLAKWGVSLTPWLEEARDYRLTKLFVFAPTSYHWRDLLLGPLAGDEGRYQQLLGSMDWAQTVGAFFVGLWLYVLFALMIGFAYSYFWTATTLIYFLLRKSVDDTDTDEVYVEEEEEEAYQTPAPAPESKPGTLPMVEPAKTTTPSNEPPPASAGEPAPATPSDGNPPPS